MPGIKEYVKYLNLIAKHAPKANKGEIKELANAFQTKKLTKYKQIEKVAVMLATRSPAGERAYNKLMGVAAPQPIAVPAAGADLAPPRGGSKKGAKREAPNST